MMRVSKQKGFTLVEIAIVLVIMGLLLGGILKGQELINNAKVRQIADHTNSFKVAWYAFVDRYQNVPGDWAQATTYIAGAGAAATTNGNGNGLIAINESPLAMYHLRAAGYLRCAQCTAVAVAVPSANNSLLNSYGGIMSVFHDSAFYAILGGAGGRARLQMHTGPRIPSNIMSEVDRKVDDGIPNNGDFVFNNYDPAGASGVANGAGAPVTAQCISVTNGAATSNGTLVAATNQFWRPGSVQPPIENNCGGAVFF